jgi:hypothetical protein
MAVGFAIVAPAFGDSRSLRDDQLPYGPDGTIGRGTDSAGGEWVERSGIKLYGSGSRDFAPGHSWSYSTARPYQSNRCYQPGDGYRYPLYYDPATRTYFYYPARR